jgi:hypothetical protein
VRTPEAPGNFAADVGYIDDRPDPYDLADNPLDELSPEERGEELDARARAARRRRVG